MIKTARRFPIGWSIAVGIGIIVISMFAMLFTLAVFSLVTYHRVLPPRHALSIGSLLLIQNIGYIPIVLFLFATLPRLAQCSLTELGLRRPNWPELRAGIWGAGLAFIGVTITANLMTFVTHRHVTQRTLLLFQHLHGSEAGIAAITGIVIAPFVEELIFRAFLFNALSSWLSLPLSLVGSSLLFGLAHFDLGVALPLTVCGIVLAGLYHRTGCLWSNITAHALFNSISFVALFALHVAV